MLQVNYASSNYLASCYATLPHKGPPTKMPKFIHDPLHFYHVIPHHNYTSPQKNKSTKKSLLLNNSITSVGKKRDSRKKIFQIYSSQNFEILKSDVSEICHFVENTF